MPELKFKSLKASILYPSHRSYSGVITTIIKTLRNPSPNIIKIKNNS